jgi:hypothetical protein
MSTDSLAVVADGLGLAALLWFGSGSWTVAGWRCSCGHWQVTDRSCDHCGHQFSWEGDCGVTARASTGPESEVTP